MFKNLESRCIHEGQVVFPDFDDLVYVESIFSNIGFDCLLKINEQICPRFILEFYSQYRVKYTLEGQMLIDFVIQNQFFSFTLKESGQILGIPSKGACSFTDKWSLDDLQYSVPTSGPYQTNPPYPDEIKNYVQEEREGLVTRIHHKTVVLVEENEILTREIVTIMKSWVEIIRENVFCLGGNQDHDDDEDGNDEGTSCASTPSPTRFVNSLTNEVPRVFGNPPNIDPKMESFYSRQTEILNRQVQLRDEQQGGIRSIGKGFKNLWRQMKK
ncbi:hypothetical protein Tco_0712266 [Tanacetum coccineum]